jgi:hypothetical protein
MSQQDEGVSVWGWVTLMFIGIAVVVSLFDANKPPDGKYYPASSEERAQREYAKQRVKMEGYSDADADTAADAIMKFQRAQQNRK